MRARQLAGARAATREAGAYLQLVAGKRVCLPFGDSGVGQGMLGSTRWDRGSCSTGQYGWVQSHEPCVRARKVGRPELAVYRWVSLVIHRSQAQVAADLGRHLSTPNS
jgi:hypothetical protein